MTQDIKKVKKHRRQFNKPSHGHGGYDSAFNGISLFIQGKCPHIKLVGDWNQRRNQIHQIVCEYLHERGYVHNKSNRESNMDLNCNQVQENWPDFKKLVLAYPSLT